MIKVSVIVPVYNGEKFIEECIKNVLNQTLEEFELIIINDGSTDNTLDICKRNSEIDKKIRIINQENEGVSSARNKGIEQSNGEYICFVDCDDKIEDNYLEELYNTCEENNVKISCCTIESIDNKGNIISSRFMEDGYYKKIDALDELFKFRGLNWGPCGKLFHKSLIKGNLKFPNLHVYEDLSFVYKAIYSSEGIYFTNKCKYYYIHRHNVGAMDKFIKYPTTDVITISYEILEFIKKQSLPIWDTSFYGVISQVIMYINDINKIDCKWEKEESKNYIKETRKLLGKYRIDLLRNKTIYYKEKIIFLILSFSPRLYKIITQ